MLYFIICGIIVDSFCNLIINMVLININYWVYIN